MRDKWRVKLFFSGTLPVREVFRGIIAPQLPSPATTAIRQPSGTFRQAIWVMAFHSNRTRLQARTSCLNCDLRFPPIPAVDTQRFSISSRLNQHRPSVPAELLEVLLPSWAR